MGHVIIAGPILTLARAEDRVEPGHRRPPGALTVLNIITVHWRSPKWIAPQLDYLEHNLDVPYRIFASLNGIDDPALWQRFHYAADLEGTHAEKLNALARVAIDQSDPGDQLLFLDGDAFPVRPIGSWVASTLQSVPLAAVRRDENLGDHQPHPCFCFTTCQFWESVDGDWREGAPGSTRWAISPPTSAGTSCASWRSTTSTGFLCSGATPAIPIRCGSASTGTGSTTTAPASTTGTRASPTTPGTSPADRCRRGEAGGASKAG